MSWVYQLFTASVSVVLPSPDRICFSIRQEIWREWNRRQWNATAGKWTPIHSRKWKLLRLFCLLQTEKNNNIYVVFYSNPWKTRWIKKILPTSRQPSHDIKTTLKYLNRASKSVSPEGLAGPCPQTFPGGPVCLCMCVNEARAVAPLWGQQCV